MNHHTKQTARDLCDARFFGGEADIDTAFADPVQRERVIESCRQAIEGGEVLATLLGIGPADLEEIYSRGFQAYMVCDFEKAALDFASATLLQPYDRRFHMGFASSLQQLGHHQDALQFFLHATHLQSDDPGAVFRIGECLIALENPEEAIEAFEVTLELCAADDRHTALAGKTVEYLEQLRR
ncbi:SycD/LcrH family type III secretion system chaperone [Paludibacterium paludis]|uniref:Tetratricopeptide repeat protein n=1 Tax=Paludibacterium paludis TaxID=1225769 RepID=A0A918UAM4_9NEIS|nr:SycD/LcrH family type III secretion system chaperone [Paludibacterium paludis]GGY23138.1 hypothetical protein GCM10011289_28630 [Paludibacterium paludis]